MANILVVEDEADLCELLVDAVESMGHSATVARDGREAMTYLATNEPQVILSDINMPNMSGCEFRREMVETLTHLNHVPFIFVSAYAEKDDITDAMDVGADHFITKPIDFDLLTELVESLVGGDHGASASPH